MLERELAEMLVEVLHLEIAAADIDPSLPLYGEQGLGLDSIDVLEMAVAISKKYGVKLRHDLMKGIGPFATRQEAEAAEKDVAEALEKRGHLVFWG